MCTPDEIAAKARMKVRDFPQYFEVPYTASPVYTLRAPHPNVDPNSVVVWMPDGTLVAATEYQVDGRNGLIKLKTPTSYPDGLGVSGYFYEWFMNEDLAYQATIVSNQHLHNNDKADDGSGFSAVECDVIATGTVAMAMWSLMAEFATDIDVSTPEGMMIPAHQRFEQMSQMSAFWTQQYKDEAALIGVGLGAFEQFTLRRVAKLTNRYVPVYKAREVDDPRPPTRLFPAIPDGTMDGEDESVVMPEPPSVGWSTLGSSGG
jgi:hypothetical protein